MEEILVPLGLFAIIPVTFGVVSFNHRKTRAAMADVMKSIVDKGQPLTPEVIASLGIRPTSAYRDLRFGLVLIAVGLATLFFGAIIPDPDGQAVMAGISAFPILVGAVYTVLWLLIGRKQDRFDGGAN